MYVLRLDVPTIPASATFSVAKNRFVYSISVLFPYALRNCRASQYKNGQMANEQGERLRLLSLPWLIIGQP